MHDFKKYSVNNPRQIRIANAIIYFVAGTLQSLSLVESTQFKELIQSLDPRASIPSRKHLSTKLIVEKAEEIRKIFCLKLQIASSISVVIDIWSVQ